MCRGFVALAGDVVLVMEAALSGHAGHCACASLAVLGSRVEFLDDGLYNGNHHSRHCNVGQPE